MVGRPNLGPRGKLLGEVLVLAIPTTTAVWLANIGLVQSILLVSIVLLLATVGKYVLVYAPDLKYREQRLTSFVDEHLALVVADYENRYDPAYDVRVNVMRPQSEVSLTHGGRGVSVGRDHYLQIAFHAGGGPDRDLPTHDGGRRDETETEWGLTPPQGNCGRAYVERQTRVATRDPSVDHWDGQVTTGDQDEATIRVNSVANPDYSPRRGRPSCSVEPRRLGSSRPDELPRQ